MGLRKRNRLCVESLLLACAAAGPAFAQESEDALNPQSLPPEAPALTALAGGRVYRAADFARFAPRNAADMLRQVPGFIVQRPDARRGLGEGGGNVLINGRRTSGKSNDALTELGRIPARNVERIEILDGASLDIPGLSGQVANVVARLGGTSGQFAWRPEFRPGRSDPMLLRGDASLSGSAGPVGYTIGIRNEAFRGGGKGPSLIFDSEGLLLETRDEVVTVRSDRPKLNGSFKYEGADGSIANLNLSYGRNWFSSLELSDRSAPGFVDRNRRVRSTEKEYSYEIGGDYEFGLGPGQLKLIALRQFEQSPFDTRAITRFASGAAQVGSRFTRTADEAENIGRAEYRWKNGSNDWQVSAEWAYNSLDNVSGLFTLRPGGEFVSVPLPGGTAKVEEDRGEIRATWGRPLSSTLALQASLGGEYSELRVSGAGGSSRSFYRPKGFVSAAWKASPRLDLNVKLDRAVGQLNFSDFLASVNLSNENRNAANPELVPPQSWELDLSANRNLGAFGSTSLRFFGRLFSDVVDQIPIGETGESAGNLESATVYGVESRGTFLFDPLGWRGAKLDARFTFQNSSVEDPLTGELRRISNSPVRNIDLNLRHDVAGTEWAWGTNLQHNRSARSFRLGELSYSYDGPVFGIVYIERKNVLGFTIRSAWGNIYGARNVLDRIVYTGRRTGPIAFIEQRRRAGGPFFAFSISGSI